MPAATQSLNQQLDSKRYVVTTGVCYAALLTIGAYVGLFGPILPDLARRSGVGLGAAGAIFTALFAGGLLSTFVGGRALDRFGRRWPLVVGLAINGLALVIIPWSISLPMLLAAGTLIGIGDGAVIVATHVVVAEAHRDREAEALNTLNVFFGVGAVAGPALGALVRLGGGRAALLLIAFGMAQWIYAAVIAVAELPLAVTHKSGNQEAESKHQAPHRSPLLWLLAGMLSIYVGIEVGLGGWAYTFARDAAGLGATPATVLASGFWCALTLGRLCSPYVLRRISPVALLVAAPMLSAVAVLAMVLGGSVPVILVAGVLVAGFGFGPVWPVTFAIAQRAFVGAAGNASGTLAMLSSFGGLALPWMQGRVLEGAGPRPGMAVTLAGCVAVSALAYAAPRMLSRPPA